MESAAVCLSQESTQKRREKVAIHLANNQQSTTNNQQQHDAAATYLILENPINQISAFSWPPVALFFVGALIYVTCGARRERERKTTQERKKSEMLLIVVAQKSGRDFR